MWSIKKRKKKNEGAAHSVKGIAERKKLSAIRYPLSAKDGFTLIELFVAASIVGLIGLAVLATFGGGFHVYERVQSYGGVQADILFSLEEMERDLRNIFSYAAIGFGGDAQSVDFPALIEGIETTDEEDRAVSSIGRISYYLDGAGDAKVLMRGQQDYSGAVAGAKTEWKKNSALALIDDIKFSYYSFDAQNKKYGWKDSWGEKPEEEGGFPAGVKVQLSFQDSGRSVQLVRTVFIPVARVAEKKEGEGG